MRPYNGGENHRGLLHLREKPAGDWGRHAEQTVKQENEDRVILMRREAKETDKQIHEIEALGFTTGYMSKTGWE